MESKVKISSYLCHGEDNAVTQKYLCAMLGLSGREIRLLIQQERLEGTPILSNCQGGYFLPACDEDIEHFIRSMRHRAGEICRAADALEQGLSSEGHSRTTRILEFVAQPVPRDWDKWPIDRRREFWAQTAHEDIELVPRDRITAAEVWCELFNRDLQDFNRADTRKINAVLDTRPEWERAASVMRFGPYNVQRGFVRKKHD